MRRQATYSIVVGHIRVDLQRDLELLPRSLVILLLEVSSRQVRVVNRGHLIQLDRAIVIGDGGRKPLVEILNRSQIVPRHRIFLLQLNRTLEVGTRRCSMSKLQLSHADLVHQHDWIASLFQRVDVVIQRVLGEASRSQHITDQLQLLGSRCRRIWKMRFDRVPLRILVPQLTHSI